MGNKDKKEKDSVLIREFTDDQMLMVGHGSNARNIVTEYGGVNL